MADDLSLLLKIKGDSAGATKAAADTRAAIASLKTSSTANLSAIQAATKGPIAGFQNFTNVTQSLSAATSALHGPLGGIASRISSLGTLARESAEGLSATAGAAASTGASLAALAGPIGLAVVAIAGLSAGVGLLVKGLFNLAQSTADYQGKLFDLSQQTGVSVETLSALEFAARKTGSNLDSITSSLVLFQTKLEEAQDSSTKTGKLFDELNISTTNTEDAFRDALKALAAMPEGFHQTDQAAELFGRRGAKQLLAILKESKGDIDAVTGRLNELGVLVTGPMAAAADEFNDSLLALQLQFRALVGKEVIPAATQAVKDLSKTLEQNRDAINAIGFVIGAVSRIIGQQFTQSLTAVQAVLEQHRDEVELLVSVYERVADALERVRQFSLGAAFSGALGGTGTGVDVPGGLGEQFGIDASVGGGVFRKSQKDARKAALDEAADAAAKELEQQRKLTADLQFERDKRGADIEKDFLRQKKLYDDHLQTLQNQIAREREINQQALAAGGILQAEFDDKKRDLDLRATQAKNARDEEVRRLTLEKDRALLNEELLLRTRAAQLEETRREGELNRLKALLERGAITEAEYLKRQRGYLTAAHVERMRIINFELAALVTTAERKAELDTEKRISEQKYTDEFKRLTRERITALQEEGAMAAPSGKLPQQGDVPIADKPPRPKGLGINFEDNAEAFNLFGRALNEHLTGDKLLVAQAGLMALETSFRAVAEAVGSAVQAFVLFGGAGQGLRQFTATLISEIAKMAAVEAVWNLAQGVAKLAMNFFWPDPRLAASAAMHFKAAAIFGGMAVIAAGVGRAAAGSSFSQSGGGGGGSGSSAGRNPSSGGSAAELKPQDFNRRNLNTPPVEVRVSFAPGIEDFLEAKILKNVNTPGKLRDAIGNK